MRECRFGDPSLPDRFWSKVERGMDDCWLWIGAHSTTGYGRYNLGHRVEYAHRVTYTTFRGEIPKGMHTDHLCRHRPCVNPAHLEVVTPAENMARGSLPVQIVRRRGACSNGHARNPENLYIDGKGYSHCRPCRRVESLRERHDIPDGVPVRKELSERHKSTNEGKHS